MLKKIFICSLALLFYLICAPINAQDKQNIHLPKEVLSYLNNLQSLQTTFLQSESKNTPVQGELWIKKPGKMKFFQKTPTPFVVYAKENNVILHDVEIDEISYMDFDDVPFRFLFEPHFDWEEEIEIIKIDTSPEKYHIFLKDKKTKQTLQLIFTRNPVELLGCISIEEGGDPIHIEFTHPQKNIYIPDSVFNWPQELTPGYR